MINHTNKHLRFIPNSKLEYLIDVYLGIVVFSCSSKYLIAIVPEFYDKTYTIISMFLFGFFWLVEAESGFIRTDDPRADRLDKFTIIIYGLLGFAGIALGSLHAIIMFSLMLVLTGGIICMVRSLVQGQRFIKFPQLQGSTKNDLYVLICIIYLVWTFLRISNPQIGPKVLGIIDNTLSISVNLLILFLFYVGVLQEVRNIKTYDMGGFVLSCLAVSICHIEMNSL